MKPTTKLLTFCIICTVALVFCACRNIDDDVVPNVEVRVRINVLNAKYIDLQDNYGRAVVEHEGYCGNGIIVIRVDENEYKAYDCTCTYELSDTAAVCPDDANIMGAVCPVCGSKYELLECGMPTSGKARHSLKSYHTSFASPFLIIRN